MFGERYGLERILALLAALGEPQRAAPAIHVVGSNGKSSTARFAAAALMSAGLRTGTYLSPHVTGWHERLEIDGAPIAPDAFATAVSTVREASEVVPEDVTQFEVLTAAAFVAFATEGLDAMVIEAGLGGRFDATNVFGGSAVVALTRIDLEHTALLGDTTAEIAGEKLAVVYAGGASLVTGPLDAEVASVVDHHVALTGVRAVQFEADFSWTESAGVLTIATPRSRHEDLIPAAQGRFQRDNLAVAIAATEELIGHAVPTGELRERIGRLTFPGRAEIVSRSPLTIADGAHNPAGAHALATALPGLIDGESAVLLTSVLKDKDLDGILDALRAHVSEVVATRSSHVRARASEDVADRARALGLEARSIEDPEEALGAARELAGPDRAVVIAGSLYLIEDLRRCGVLGGG